MRPVRKEDRTASESFWSAMLHAERSRQRWLWHGNIMPEVGLVWRVARLVFMTLTRPVVADRSALAAQAGAETAPEGDPLESRSDGSLDDTGLNPPKVSEVGHEIVTVRDAQYARTRTGGHYLASLDRFAPTREMVGRPMKDPQGTAQYIRPVPGAYCSSVPEQIDPTRLEVCFMPVDYLRPGNEGCVRRHVGDQSRLTDSAQAVLEATTDHLDRRKQTADRIHDLAQGVCICPRRQVTGKKERELALHARTLVREDSHGGQSIEAVRSEHRRGHRAIGAQAPLSVPTGGANFPAGARHGRQRLYPALNVVGVFNRRQPGGRFNRHLPTIGTRLPETTSKGVLELDCPNIQVSECTRITHATLVTGAMNDSPRSWAWGH